MTALAWVLSSFLVVVITLVVMGAALRPYVAELISDRDLWKARAVKAEDALSEMDQVRIVPIDAQATLQQWLKGTETHEQ